MCSETDYANVCTKPSRFFSRMFCVIEKPISTEALPIKSISNAITSLWNSVEERNYVYQLIHYEIGSFLRIGKCEIYFKLMIPLNSQYCCNSSSLDSSIFQLRFFCCLAWMVFICFKCVRVCILQSRFVAFLFISVSLFSATASSFIFTETKAIGLRFLFKKVRIVFEGKETQQILF